VRSWRVEKGTGEGVRDTEKVKGEGPEEWEVRSQRRWGRGSSEGGSIRKNGLEKVQNETKPEKGTAYTHISSNLR